jgi:hypothetical protein
MSNSEIAYKFTPKDSNPKSAGSFDKKTSEPLVNVSFLEFQVFQGLPTDSSDSQVAISSESFEAMMVMAKSSNGLKDALPDDEKGVEKLMRKSLEYCDFGAYLGREGGLRAEGA